VGCLFGTPPHSINESRAGWQVSGSPLGAKLHDKPELQGEFRIHVKCDAAEVSGGISMQ
jgi:hypothetical protein